MSMNKFFPVPSRKKTKKSIDDEMFINPLTRSYETYLKPFTTGLPETVPPQFIQSNTPSIMSSITPHYTIPTQNPLDSRMEQRARSEATLQALIGQQDTLQSQLDITNVGSMESLKEFVSMYSNQIRPELRQQYFGRIGSLPVSAIGAGLRGMPTGEKKNILTELVSQHNLAEDYLAFHDAFMERKQIRRDMTREAESSAMAEARAATTRHTQPRHGVSIHGADSMNNFVNNPRDILNEPSATVNPLFTGGGGEQVETE
jgi:hypothetical protein